MKIKEDESFYYICKKIPLIKSKRRETKHEEKQIKTNRKGKGFEVKYSVKLSTAEIKM